MNFFVSEFRDFKKNIIMQNDHGEKKSINEKKNFTS